MNGYSTGRVIGWTLAALALALVAACGGGGGGGGDSRSTAVAQGHDEFRKVCSTCHGPNAEGMPRLGKDLHGNEFVAGLDDAELLEFLKVGRSAGDPLNERGVDMPPKGGNPALTDEQMTLIIAYMRSLT